MSYDLAFIGHMCIDRIVPFQGDTQEAPGSAVLCGAMAAARTGREIAVVSKMSPDDDWMLQPMRDAGADTFLIPAEETTFMEVIHPTADVDVRQMFQRSNAGRIHADEIPDIDAQHAHFAGVTDQEFDVPLMAAVKARGWTVSTDMQSFVRQVDRKTREIDFADVPNKREIVALMDKLKLDIVEARLLTGEDDIAAAAEKIAGWGCDEVVITQGEGVLARVAGRATYERFSNRSIIGRTGRGDTTFAAYLCRRFDHDVAESLRFAAALVSLKMETPGPFRGTLDDVLRRMAEAH